MSFASTIRRARCAIALICLLAGSFRDVTAQTLLPLPADLHNARGQTIAQVVQGDGKVIIAGVFSEIGAESRQRLARINLDGSLDASFADPQVDQAISAIAIAGGSLIIAGGFSTVNGTPRHALAALSLADGSLLPWDPNADAAVIAIAVEQDIVYVGGQFSHVGGQVRSELAAIRLEDGTATDWNPGVSGVGVSYLRSILVDDGVVYVGGVFDHVAGQSRVGLAAINQFTGDLTSWDPQMNSFGFASALAKTADTIFVAGYFTSIGHSLRPNIAALSATTGDALAWNANADNGVNALLLDGDTLYVAGYFNHIGGAPRSSLAALDVNSAQASGWAPQVDQPYVYSLSGWNNTVYAGGQFTSVGESVTGGFARIDKTTGLAAAVPQVRDIASVVSMQTQTDGKVIVGGLFTDIQGVARNNLARLNSDGSLDLSWNPGGAFGVQAIALTDSTVYLSISGQGIVGGQSRSGLAAVDVHTGLATDWQPSADNTVSSIAIAGNTVYMGGDFTQLDGQPRNILGAVDGSTGDLLAWNPSVNVTGRVRAILPYDGHVFVGGAFTAVGGQTRNIIASLDPITGAADSWDASANGSNVPGFFEVFSLAAAGDTLYVGGAFQNIGGQTRPNLAALDVHTAQATAWNPMGTNGIVWSILTAGDTLYAAGIFNQIGGAFGSGVFALDRATAAVSVDWRPSLDYAAITLAASSGMVYIGGNFTTVDGSSREGLAAVSAVEGIFQDGFE